MIKKPLSEIKRIAILTPCVINGDAVSNDVIGMHLFFQKMGYQSSIFAENWINSEVDIFESKKIFDFIKYDSDCLIYHFSVGWDNGLDILNHIKSRKIIKYHNVTPPDFFSGINEDYATVCRAGRNQLKIISKGEFDLYLSDSFYNSQELISDGAPVEKCFVIPPFHHIDRLDTIEADLECLMRYKDNKKNILMVGRIAPNKGHLELIKSFSNYHKNYNKNSRLLIVGKQDERLWQYTASIHDLISNLGLEDSIVITGEASDNLLKAFYLISNTFMITSKHEGFCVPLIEAMSMKIPIIAFGSSAIKETIGNAGLVWEELDPELFAESLNTIYSEEKIMLNLGYMGWNRYITNYTNEIIEKKLLKVLGNFL